MTTKQLNMLEDLEFIIKQSARNKNCHNVHVNTSDIFLFLENVDL
jgi:hypothetical protein